LALDGIFSIIGVGSVFTYIDLLKFVMLLAFFFNVKPDIGNVQWFEPSFKGSVIMDGYCARARYD